MAECWVREYGTFGPEGVQACVNACLCACPMSGAVAFFTDHFDAAYPEGIAALLADPSHLLEARVYGKECELWIHRTCIGDPFSWRLAVDEGVPKDARREETQWLDIDASRHSNLREDGLTLLRTTGGGRYGMPVSKEQNAVRVAVYYRYDEDGCAHAADFRIIGFERRTD